jgi:hypothetical protein
MQNIRLQLAFKDFSSDSVKILGHLSSSGLQIKNLEGLEFIERPQNEDRLKIF